MFYLIFIQSIYSVITEKSDNLLSLGLFNSN